MSIHIEWDNPEHTVLRWVFTEGWTWEEMQPLAAPLDAALRTRGGRVDCIFDFTDAAAPPTTGALPTLNTHCPLCGYTVVIGMEAHAHIIHRLATRLYAAHDAPQVHFVPDLESARAYIHMLQMAG